MTKDFEETIRTTIIAVIFLIAAILVTAFDKRPAPDVTAGPAVEYSAAAHR